MANSPARAAVDVGSVIADTYTIEALLGRGGMGSVFLASHKRLAGKHVAIKILHTEIEDVDVIARFKREAEIAAKLNHPNIVGVIDYNVAPDGMPYLVLDYLEGETLAQRIARGPMVLDHVLSILRQVGSALGAAHRAGIVHRDLKPQNIFLVPTEVDGREIEIAKVLDFGISKIRGSQTVKTQDSMLLGTPQYMAPEQATGQHDDIDERTDVFALGAIVYEMLSGRPAFEGDSLPVVVFKVVYEQPPPLAELAPSVPAAILAAVARAMAKPLDERFPTVGSFVEALTGQPLSLARGQLPSALGGEAPSGARRGAAGDAFAQTMGSGDHGDSPANPLLATAAPAAANLLTPSTRSAKTTPNRPKPSSPARAADTPAPVALQAAPSPSVATPPAVAPATPTVTFEDGARGKPIRSRGRSVGVIAALAILGAAIAAVTVYIAMRHRSPELHDVVVNIKHDEPPPPRIAAAGSELAKAADAKATDAKVADAKAADAKAADAKATDAKATDAKATDAKAADAKAADAKATDAKAADAKAGRSGIGKPDPKRHRRPDPKPPLAEEPGPLAAAPAEDSDGDDVRDKLKQAMAAVDSKQFDLAERLANAVINSQASPKQRAAARLLHGQIQCIARNDQEAAQIDVRSLERFRALRTRLLNVCRNHGIEITP